MSNTNNDYSMLGMNNYNPYDTSSNLYNGYNRNVPLNNNMMSSPNMGASFYGRGQNQYPMTAQQTQQTPMTNIPQSQPTANFNGRIVDGRDMVKAIDVPFGTYAVFPRADMREIYVKTWNSNGTTDTITYLPQPLVEPQPAVQQAPQQNNEVLNSLMDKLNSLEVKIDSLMPQQQQQQKNSNETKEVAF